jgi:diguanylate cyclase (GGDEF)-like protein
MSADLGERASVGTDVEDPGLEMVTGQPLLMVGLSRLNACETLDEMRAAICDGARSMGHADGALLFEADSAGDTLELTFTLGPADSAIDTYRLSRELAVGALSSGHAQSSRDCFPDPDLEWLASGWRDGGRLCLTYPLRVKGRAVGALAVICLGRGALQGREIWALRRFHETAAARLRDARERNALRAEALTDPLTGIANRRGLEVALAAAGEGFGLMMVDFDDLKKLNDQAGYETGDDVLVAIGAALRDEERPGETAVRLGGDEFMLLVPNATAAELEHRADALAHRLDRLEVPAKARDLYHGASVGVALAERGELSNAAIQRASEQMKSQKRRRKSDRLT